MNTALARLRAKTDQDLGILIARQLKRSLADASRRNYEDAARGYQSARSLLAVAHLSSARREQLERSLAELRGHLAKPASAVA
jgi:hypothetical protein